MANSKRWVVTSSGKLSLNEVKKKLTQAGFSVDQVYEEIGSISGAASDDVAKRLRSLPEVADISPEPSVDIGPPNAPVTW